VTIDRLPKEIRDALRKLEPKLRRAFLDAIGDIRKAVDPSAIARLIEAGDIEAAIKAMRFEPSLFGPIDRTLEEAYRDAGIAALAALPVIRDPNLGGRFVIGFDGRHPRAELWARQMSSRLITEIVDDQRNMAREQIQSGVTAGRSPITTALDIVGRINKATGQREGGFIGLTSGQARWVSAARDQLEAGQFAEFRGRNLRNKSLDRLIRKAEKEGRKLTKREIDQILRGYTNNILRYRGENIARTESITALRAGAMEGYRQLVESGAVSDNQIVRRWRATGDVRTRDSHNHMNDVTLRGLSAPWVVGSSLMMYPGDTSLGAAAEETINCRCFVEYRIKYD
jgi:hypothetical protein